MELATFQINKTIQAAGVLLKLEPRRRMTRLRLLKLLYIADRKSILLHGRPITGDRPVAMEHGPVLSQTYDLIKGSHSKASSWLTFFTQQGKEVVLANDPSDGELSNREIAILSNVFKDFYRYSDSELRSYVHEFKEYLKNEPKPNRQNPIPLHDLLEALGLSDKEKLLLETVEAENEVDRLFAAYQK